MESTSEVEVSQSGVSREKDETLRHFSETYWGKLDYHREKEYRIFVWTSVILFGAIATLAVSRTGEVPIFARYGLLGKTVLSMALIVWTTVSIRMQIRERKFGDQYVMVIVGIARMLHAFDNGYFHAGGDPSTLLPCEWEKWPSQVNQTFPRCLMRNYIPPTFLVGLFAAVLPWLH